MMKTLEAFSYISNIAMALIAGGAVYVATSQLQSSRVSQREATAYALYANYLELAIEYYPLANAHPQVPPPNDIGSLEFQQYEWFVSLMLQAFEQILDLTDDDAWRRAIEDQLAIHKDYLVSGHFVRAHYSAPLRALMPSVTESASKSD